MCLFMDKKVSKKFVEEHSETVTAYKVVKRTKHGLDSVLYQFRWRPGVNVSNRTSEDDKWCERFSGYPILQVNRGIHVFFDEYAARCWAGDPRDTHNVILLVQCDMKDFVGCDPLKEQGVFSKIFLSQEEYNKGMEAIPCA